MSVQVVQTPSLQDQIHDDRSQVLVMKDTIPLRGVLVTILAREHSVFGKGPPALYNIAAEIAPRFD